MIRTTAPKAAQDREANAVLITTLETKAAELRSQIRG